MHLHASFDVLVFLRRARANLCHNWTALDLSDPPLGYALLADPEGSHSLPRLRAARHHSFSIVPTQESCSLVVRFSDGARLLFVAGRQIRTRERLEVLAFGSECSQVGEGQSFRATLLDIWALGGHAVVPWGLGKWTFERGRLVSAIVAEAEAATLFLGDNGSRLRGTRPHPIFAAAARRGIWNLPGSDALPFPDEVGKVMTYGSSLAMSADLSTPHAALRRVLTTLDQQPAGFGSLEAPVRFVWAQARMHGRRWKRTTA